MKQLRSLLIASIKNRKINVFLLFFVLAFVILIFTKLSKEYTNTIPFAIQKMHVPQEYVILNDTAKVNITLKTHGFKWLSYYFSKPKIKVDFKKDVYKEGSFFVYSKSKAYLNNTQFDKAVELLNINPEKLTFKFDVNQVKKLPVKINTQIAFSPGYDKASNMVSEPDSIVIIGPKALVSSFSFLETEPLVLKDVRSHISQPVAINLPQNQPDLKFSHKKVVIKAGVEKFTEGAVKVPVTLINVPNGVKVKYFPKDISVSYYVSLSNFKSVTNKSFKVVGDFNNAKGDQAFLKLEVVEIPKTVRNVKLSQKQIEFIIVK
ncbi:YbbR-like domain-containing protein [Tamlana fucoidanivorans]|uniref:YbbR-like domain-containing protein n=1 Tax=Allotamlana fucoidanivorans TaxID=2583814 RepID=A0A5C4SHN7_9FLAO|nr:YbbR-like domain-containing protein [Tamlana fucoidanivorans]